MWDEYNCVVVRAFFGIAFLWDWDKNWIFQSSGHCWVFQICWHIECSTFTASYLRIWNSSTGIPSPPLALFVLMLPKPHLTSHSRMSGSRWVITPLWLSRSWRSFLYNSAVYSYHLFLICSASVRSMPLLSFIEPIFEWNVPLVSLIFLKRSLVFPILLFSSIALHWSLRRAFWSLLAILWNSTFKWVTLLPTFTATYPQPKPYVIMLPCIIFKTFQLFSLLPFLTSFSLFSMWPSVIIWGKVSQVTPHPLFKLPLASHLTQHILPTIA